MAVDAIEADFQIGLITEDERHAQVVDIWNQATDDVTDALKASLNEDNPVYMMATSGPGVISSRSVSWPVCAV